MNKEQWTAFLWESLAFYTSQYWSVEHETAPDFKAFCLSQISAYCKLIIQYDV